MLRGCVLAALLVVALASPAQAGRTGGAEVSFSTDASVYRHHDLDEERTARHTAEEKAANRVVMTFVNLGKEPLFTWQCDSWWVTDEMGHVVARARWSVHAGTFLAPGSSVTCHWALWSDETSADAAEHGEESRQTLLGFVPEGKYVVHWAYSVPLRGWYEAQVPIEVRAGVEGVEAPTP